MYLTGIIADIFLFVSDQEVRIDCSGICGPGINLIMYSSCLAEAMHRAIKNFRLYLSVFVIDFYNF